FVPRMCSKRGSILTTASIRRIVPDIYSDALERRQEFYSEFLDLDLDIDMGWILTFVSKTNKTAQLSIFKNDSGKAIDNTTVFLSIEVSDIDSWYQRAKDNNIEITYPLTNEPWNVRRFFVKDPNGVTINLLMHL